jgi:hypothetical protein
MSRPYLLDNARAEAGERFTWLAELFDGVTRGHFERLGVTAGSRCWEVGAGGPGIPEALAAVGGPACGRLEAATVRHVRGELIAAGLADAAEIDARLAAIDAGELDLTLAPLISAWGRSA